ncbi:unnamed protein product, partial [marine sediment metagenome]
LKYVRQVCKMHKVELYLGRGNRVVYPDCLETKKKDGDREARTMGSGYWMEPGEGEAAKLGVATARSRWLWLGTLAHELCHLMQWLECEPTYCSTLPGGKDPNALVDDWLQGKEFNKRIVKQAIQSVVDVELDNERRAVRLIKKFKLPVDLKKYIQAANSYLFFHEVVMENRTWYNKLMFNPEIINHMPDHFLPEDSYKVGKMPREFVTYLEDHVINSKGWSWKNRRKIAAK